MTLSRLWLAARAGIELTSVALLVRTRALPDVLRRLRGARPKQERPDPRRLSETARVVARVSRLRFFDLPVFPHPCLRRSLALFSLLSRDGYEPEIHFGVLADGKSLHGHSWVTVDGATVCDSSPTASFRTVYSYPSRTNFSPRPSTAAARSA